MVTNQALLFAIFIINGIIIGLVFDFFRILRKSFRTNDIITYIEDILFWIITGLILLYSIFTFNNGEIRLFMFLGAILGCIIYMIIFSKFIIKINTKIIRFLKKSIKKAIIVILYPIKIIIKVIKKIFNKPISFIIINIKGILKKVKSNIKNSKKTINTKNI